MAIGIIPNHPVLSIISPGGRESFYTLEWVNAVSFVLLRGKGKIIMVK